MSSQIFPQAIKIEAYKTFHNFHINVRCVRPVKLSSDWDWDLGLGTWDLGLGTWDLGPVTWDL